ncbi:hypothetical protein lerEdw1_002802 [Lerista edwardsae]|nr:hypothetical protein lerEdw1_002802 [Lerista edwardsae]
MVQTLLQQMQDKFQTMSDQIIGRIDDMSCRIDDLEKNIADLMTQAGVEELEGENKAAAATNKSSSTVFAIKEATRLGNSYCKLPLNLGCALMGLEAGCDLPSTLLKQDHRKDKRQKKRN